MRAPRSRPLLVALFPCTIAAGAAAQALAMPTTVVEASAAGNIPTPAEAPRVAANEVRERETTPWRAHETLGVPWFRFGFEQRVRFEHLENDFRSSNKGDATGLFTRTLAYAELRSRPFVIGGEFQDSRAWTSDATPLNTTLVDALEPIRASIGVRSENTLERGDATEVTAGRMTIDLGSRRLVARNDFRGTINSFTGVDVTWTASSKEVVRAFAVMPVVRLPSAAAALRDNAFALGQEGPEAILWATLFQTRPLAARLTMEAYVLGFHERDGGAAPSANRRLYTPGLRAVRTPFAGNFDFQIEIIGQMGRSRSTPEPTDTADLEHRAMSIHASGGFRFVAPMTPRIVAQYDYASGDRSPVDGQNNRFDPLFGARRFEFGPTGLYGAIGRANVNTPGVRLELQPDRSIDCFAAYRLVWLASAEDAWSSAALRDPTGGSGTFLGHQIEGRVRWEALPKNLAVEAGSALLVRGGFAKEAPGASVANPIYFYTQVTGTI